MTTLRALLDQLEISEHVYDDLDEDGQLEVQRVVLGLRRAVEAALGHNPHMRGEHYHYAHGYADAVANIRHAITAALTEEADRGRS